jgi:presenilin-like A22 family membrane protease
VKHTWKITLILLAMFVVTQFIGLYVVNFYATTQVINGIPTSISAPDLPFGLAQPAIEQESDFYKVFPSLIIAFIFAILLLFFLTKFKAEFVLKAWFFLVVIIALSIALNSFLFKIPHAIYFALVLAIVLAVFKTYKRNIIVHNLTELLIYPGVAAVFVPILNIWTIIILLILISIYDMWAVWHSGIMQKMAKYQMNKLKIFSGFYVPYLTRELRMKLKKLKKSKNKNKKLRIQLAILGGGDVVFPIITAGVMLKTFGILPALFVILGATLGLAYLFFIAEKKKFYPAMPFISAGIFIGMILSYLVSLIF